MTLTKNKSVALAFISILLSYVLIVLANANPSSADNPWPTPPPGPKAPLPRVISEDNIKPVEVPQVAGATRWVILPLAMPIPRFPPVPSSTFQSPDGVQIVSDAGSINTTVQLTYAPVPVDEARAPHPHQELRRVFDIRVFDHSASRIDLELRRPWVLEVPVTGLTKSFENPARLLIARYDEGTGWVPLVTSYYASSGILQARVLQVGRFAVLAEPGVS